MQKKLTNGVWGFARVTTYSVASGSTQLSSALLANAELHLCEMSVSDAGPSPSGGGGTSSGCAFTPSPFATTTTDGQGAFAFAAPPGSYRLEACATHADKLGIVQSQVQITTGAVHQNLDFNDVPQ